MRPPGSQPKSLKSQLIQASSVSRCAGTSLPPAKSTVAIQRSLLSTARAISATPLPSAFHCMASTRTVRSPASGSSLAALRSAASGSVVMPGRADSGRSRTLLSRRSTSLSWWPSGGLRPTRTRTSSASS